MVTQRLTMSAVTNTHKINGNLIVSANANAAVATTTTTASSSSSSSKTFLHTNPHPSSHQHHQHQHHATNQLQPSPNSLQQQHQSQHSTNLKSSSSAIGLSKLQAPQQHQRRSFIPSATLQQQQQQQQHQHITVATSGTVTQPPQANQLQTVATIHQPSTPGQQLHTVQSASSSLGAVGTTQTQTTSTTAAGTTTALSGANTDQLTNPSNRRSFYHLQSLKSATNLKAPAHSIPPRYQPPPQPSNTNNSNCQQQQPQHTTGILKNLHSQRLTNGTKSSTGTSNGYTSYFPETQSNGHLGNLKYPPDIPQLSSVFIPDSLKNASASNSRYLQQKHQQQTNQSQLQQRLRSVNQTTTNGTTTNNSNNNHTNNLLNGHQSALTEQQQLQQQQQDMLKFVRKSDQDHPSPNASVTSSGTGGIPSTAGRLTAEQNRQLQSLINELRALKEQNQRLMDDNQELRDLCCFLDDDRQKGRKLAREWQRFGRYTASVMRQEVAAYQNKLRQLDDKQQELITDNLELKELCLYLDEERAHIAANSLCVNCGASTRNTLRDDGDGSSSSTNADENITALRNYERQLPDLHLRSTLQDQTLQYVRSLERRIQQLEEERLTNTTNAATTANMASQQQQQQHRPSQQHTTQQQQQHQQQLHQPTNVTTTAVTNHQNQKITTQTSTSSSPSALNDGLVDPISGRPEAVVRALQVLEVREQLERDRLGHLTGNAIDQMDDGEKALVREMCNVVWRKLEASPNGPTTLEPL